MTDYIEVAATYTRAMTIAREAYQKLPDEAAAAVAAIEREIKQGNPTRGWVDLDRFVKEFVNPLALIMRNRIDHAHAELLTLLKLRLALLQSLHTLASEQERFDKCAQFASEMEVLNRFLLEAFLVDCDSDSG